MSSFARSGFSQFPSDPLGPARERKSSRLQVRVTTFGHKAPDRSFHVVPGTDSTLSCAVLGKSAEGSLCRAQDELHAQFVRCWDWARRGSLRLAQGVSSLSILVKLGETELGDKAWTEFGGSRLGSMFRLFGTAAEHGSAV